MSTRPRKRSIRSNEDALAAFISRKAEIDAMLTRLQTLSDDHFGYAPDEVTWDHVGTLEHYADLLKRITDRRSTKANTRHSPPLISSTPPRTGQRRRGSGS